MWIFASFESTSEPFIQTLTACGKLIESRLLRHSRGGCRHGRILSLLLAAERTLVRARVQRLAALPAETCGGRIGAGSRTRNRRLRAIAAWPRGHAHRCRRSADLAARAKDGLEQFARALIALADIRRERFHDDVVDGTGHGRIARLRRLDEFAAHQPFEI